MSLSANLYNNFHIITASFIFFQLIYSTSYAVLTRIYPSAQHWKPHTIFNWKVHCVSFAHAIIAVFFSLSNFNDAALAENPLFGYSSSCAVAMSVSFGYFIWDSAICIKSIKSNGIGFVLHGLFCAAIYGLSLTPFLMYFGIRFLIFELSTIFLNLHWFMDKLNVKSPVLNAANSIALLFSFFGARIVFGLYESSVYYRAVFANFDKFPFWAFILFSSSNVTLTGLNFLWFYKLSRAAYRKIMKVSQD